MMFYTHAETSLDTCIKSVLSVSVRTKHYLPEPSMCECTGRGLSVFYTDAMPIEFQMVVRDAFGDTLVYVQPDDVQCSVAGRDESDENSLQFQVRTAVDACHIIQVAYAFKRPNVNVSELVLSVTVCGVRIIDNVRVRATFNGMAGGNTPCARERLFKLPNLEHMFGIAVNASDTRLVLVQCRVADTNVFAYTSPVFYVYELPSCTRLYALEDSTGQDCHLYRTHVSFVNDTEFIASNQIMLKRWTVQGTHVSSHHLFDYRPNVIAVRNNIAAIGCASGILTYTIDTDTVTCTSMMLDRSSSLPTLQYIDALCFINASTLLAWCRAKRESHGTLCTCTLDGTLLRKLTTQMIWCTSLLTCADGTVFALANPNETHGTHVYAVNTSGDDAHVLVHTPLTASKQGMSIAASGPHFYLLELFCKAGVYLSIYK